MVKNTYRPNIPLLSSDSKEIVYYDENQSMEWLDKAASTSG